MANRLDFQTKLEAILGSRNVYFQPPNNLEMHYPAIVYGIDAIRNNFANNKVYKQDVAYSVTVIDEDPDSEIKAKISRMPKAEYDRHFSRDNLNHDVFRIYF